MTTTRVCRCGIPLTDRYLCRDCTAEARRMLARLPDTLAMADETAARLDRVGSRAGARPAGSAQPLPYRPEAADAAQTARNKISNAVRVFLPALPAGQLHGTARHRCGLLSRYLDVIAASYALLPEIVEQLTDAEAELLAVVDLPAERVSLGDCDTCRRPLTAPTGAPVAQCGCGARYDVPRRVAALVEASRGLIGPASFIVSAVSRYHAGQITAERIRQWQARGRLTIAARDSRQHPLYRLGDVLDLIADPPKAGRPRKDRSA